MHPIRVEFLIRVTIPSSLAPEDVSLLEEECPLLE